jgi:hypothetical protein
MPDYYMLCVSGDWENKMFSDFKADACLVIKSVDLFSHKLEKASLEFFKSLLLGIVRVIIKSGVYG